MARFCFDRDTTWIKHQFFSPTFKSFMLLLRMPFAANLIWIFKLKEQPKTLIASVHKEATKEGCRSPLLFQSPIKTSGEVLERSTKVLWNIVRALTVLVQFSFFLTRTVMNAMIVKTGVVGEYLSVLECAQIKFLEFGTSKLDVANVFQGLDLLPNQLGDGGRRCGPKLMLT